jgi:hypothetical protein
MCRSVSDETTGQLFSFDTYDLNQKLTRRSDLGNNGTHNSPDALNELLYVSVFGKPLKRVLAKFDLAGFATQLAATFFIFHLQAFV